MKGCALVSGAQTLSELVLYTIRDLLRVFLENPYAVHLNNGAGTVAWL